MVSFWFIAAVLPYLTALLLFHMLLLKSSSALSGHIFKGRASNDLIIITVGNWLHAFKIHCNSNALDGGFRFPPRVYAFCSNSNI